LTKKNAKHDAEIKVINQQLSKIENQISLISSDLTKNQAESKTDISKIVTN
jgi:hypothetical protein